MMCWGSCVNFFRIFWTKKTVVTREKWNSGHREWFETIYWAFFLEFWNKIKEIYFIRSHRLGIFSNQCVHVLWKYQSVRGLRISINILPTEHFRSPVTHVYDLTFLLNELRKCSNDNKHSKSFLSMWHFCTNWSTVGHVFCRFLTGDISCYIIVWQVFDIKVMVISHLKQVVLKAI